MLLIMCLSTDEQGLVATCHHVTAQDSFEETHYIRASENAEVCLIAFAFL